MIKLALFSILISALSASTIAAADTSGEASGSGPVYEMRVYHAGEGKLNDLNGRFRNHTMQIFEKHGMENLVYWHKLKGQKGADTTLVYMLGHKSREAAKKSFDEFRADPNWVKVKADSEKNGSLTVPEGVKSEFLVPT